LFNASGAGLIDTKMFFFCKLQFLFPGSSIINAVSNMGTIPQNIYARNLRHGSVSELILTQRTWRNIT
jgi:hypothetical protein